VKNDVEVSLSMDRGVLVRRYKEDGHAVAFVRDGNVIRPVFDTEAGKFFPRALLEVIVPDEQPATAEQMSQLRELGWPWQEPLSQKEAALALTVWTDFVGHRTPKHTEEAAAHAAA